MAKIDPAKPDKAVVHHQSLSYSGPLPPAAEFERYEQTCPGAAERILAMAEKESTHRHGAEDLLVKEEVRASKTGQVFAFVLGIGSLIVVAVSLILDRPLGAIAPGIIALTSLATALAGSRKPKD
ncbi:MAG TPA: DUF2335 domain-containing protein [Dehalococcoidia bacterium]|nr:DUF2335 domain-containing protein [Dehalococcoidia bacterium]